MFLDNDTRLVEKMIAHDSMKAHIGRNFILFISIFLTTIMLTGVITTGFSFYQAEIRYTDMTPGPGADGFAIRGGREQEDKISQYPDVEWAALVKNASCKRLESPEVINCEAELLVTGQTFYDNNYIVLQEGNFPEAETDIMISDTLAEKYQLTAPLGKKLKFTAAVLENSQEIKKTIEFAVCGIYKNPLSAIADEYEEIYTSNAFINAFNPAFQNKPGNIYVKLNGNQDKDAIYERLQQLNDETGGLGVIAKMKEADNMATVIFILAASVTIMLAAYFIIFNVFSISLANDIRYYGMLKTIGATTKQIRSTLNRQIYILFPFAVILGLALGHGCSRYVAPGMIGLMDGLKNFYTPSPIILPSCFVTVFVLFTVKVSCWSSFQKVSRISPVEAARFSAPQRKTMVFAAISLILSCIIFSGTFTFFFGYDVTEQVNEHNIYDFKITNILYHLGNGSESFEPISDELWKELKKLPFVENMEIVYAAHSQPDSYEDMEGDRYYLRARVKNTGLLASDFQRAESEQLTYSFDRTEGDLRIPVCGVSADTIKRTLDAGNFKIADGAIEIEKFESGNYVIYQPFGWSTDRLSVHAGDNLDIQVFQDATGEYISKTMKVMAVVISDDPYGRSQFSEIGICMPDKVFKEIYTGYHQMITSVAFDSNDQEHDKEQQKQIESLLSKYSSYQVTFSSKCKSISYFEKERNTMFLIGLFFSVFFSVIGITNTINNIANSILSNRIAYARMQAVGMTQKQLARLLTLNNLKTYGIAVLLFIPLDYLLLKIFLHGFNAKMFSLSVVLVIFAIILILVVTSVIMVRYLNKSTIAQRLREIE